MVILTNLKKKDFELILLNYNIGNYVSHSHIHHSLSNTVFLLKTTRGKFILKIFERTEKSFLRLQIAIMDSLDNKHLASPKIIKTKEKKNLIQFLKKDIMIQEFIEGHEPKKFPDNLIRDIAKNQALIIKSLMKFPHKKNINWKDHQFRLYNKRLYDGFDLREEQIKIIKENKTNKKRLRKSIIHGDFHGANLIVSHEKLKAVIDWDDAHIDFISQDIATTISHMFIETYGIKKYQLKLYMKTFQEYLRLNKEEKKSIYLFILLRFLGVVAYLLKQQEAHRDQDFDKSIKKYISRFYLLKKFGFNNFNKLVF